MALSKQNDDAAKDGIAAKPGVNDNPDVHDNALVEEIAPIIAPSYRVVENVTGFVVGEIVTGGLLETPGVADRLLALGAIEVVATDFSLEAATVSVSE